MPHLVLLVAFGLLAALMLGFGLACDDAVREERRLMS